MKIIVQEMQVFSTFVYQCYVNGFGINNGKILHKQLLDNFLPNKTFLFLLSSNEILKRLKLRKKSNKDQILKF